MPQTTFLVPSDLDGESVAAALAGDETLEAEPSREYRVRFFDTFDWRLHRAGRTLQRHDGSWQLIDLDRDAVVAEDPARPGPWPRFAWDLDPDGELRRPLGKLMKMRALLHLVTAGCVRERWVVRNRDAKIILRLALTGFTPEKPAVDTRLRVLEIHPLRGYERPARLADEAATRLGLAPMTGSLLDELLVTVGLEPRGYTSKFRVDMAPTLSAIEAFAVIGRHLLHTIRQNESGLRADIDTEFLHDFRVAIRRQRSAFNHFRGVVDPAALAPYAERLADLGRRTGPLRDLDVYLLDRERYRSLIPAELRDGLEPRFERLAAERGRELAQLRRTLGSAEYRDLMRGWSDFLADPPPGGLAAISILDLARKRLRKRHARVLRDGRAIGPDSPDEALHRLRIQCKKLRYLLEFTASVFPAGEVDDLISHLKGLQDNLGEFNDLSVQRADLRSALASPSGRGQARVQEAAALGGLLTALHARHHEVRDEFAAAFADFADPAVTRHFATLCGKEATGS
ncbi:CHAD domain-containing protein [bacterium]|nr:CHAD domain-containing protein [bacterium]